MKPGVSFTRVDHDRQPFFFKVFEKFLYQLLKKMLNENMLLKMAYYSGLDKIFGVLYSIVCVLTVILF